MSRHNLYVIMYTISWRPMIDSLKILRLHIMHGSYYQKVRHCSWYVRIIIFISLQKLMGHVNLTWVI
jgi:hypothetical protein